MNFPNLIDRLFDRREEDTLKAQAFEERGKARILVEQSKQAVIALKEALEEAEAIIEKKGDYDS